MQTFYQHGHASADIRLYTYTHKLWSSAKKKNAWSQGMYTQVKSAIYLICQNVIVHRCKWDETEG